MYITQQPKTAYAIRSLAPDPTPVLHRYLPHLDGESTGYILAGGSEPYSTEVIEHLREQSSIHGVRIFGYLGRLANCPLRTPSDFGRALDRSESAELELRTRRRDSYGVASKKLTLQPLH